MASSIRLLVAFCGVICSTSCLTDDVVNISSNAADDMKAKLSVIKQSSAKKLNELSEMERMKLTEEIISYLKTIEISNDIKDHCLENKVFENSAICLKMRDECVKKIRDGQDKTLSKMNPISAENDACLKEQFAQSSILVSDIHGVFEAFIDFLETIIDELDCPASFEQFDHIAKKVAKRHDEKLLDPKPDIDKLFDHCLNKNLFR